MRSLIVTYGLEIMRVTLKLQPHRRNYLETMILMKLAISVKTEQTSPPSNLQCQKIQRKSHTILVITTKSPEIGTSETIQCK